MPVTALQLMQMIEEHMRAGRWAAAQELLRKILAQQPDYPPALFVLGTMLGQMGNYAASLPLLRRLALIDPNNYGTHNNLAIVLGKAGFLDEALHHFQLAAQLNPKDAATHRNMGNVYHDQGLQEEALRCHRRAVELAPNDAAIHSNLLYDLIFIPGWTGQMILQEHRIWSQRHEKPLASARLPFSNDPSPERQLKIGYVSADFLHHPVGRFLLPLFSHHDRQKFMICCYSDVMAPDPVTRRLRQHADLWRETSALPPQALAQQIRQDGIDILLDLAQHSGGNRMLTFARKPAPVQVAWLGYPGTSGLESMDYRLTDPYLDPPGTSDEDYSEKSIRLPHCFWCFAPPPEGSPDVGPSPALRNGYVTFGCMNRFDKLNVPTLQLWCRIMQAEKNARLIIHSKPGRHLDDIRRLFVENGVDSQRTRFTPGLPLQQYLKQLNEIDIALDPMPHGGGTTTCEALWMGVPVITILGQTPVGRGGTSILSNVGLTELIARSEDQYVDAAVTLARDLPRLTQLRSSLRQKMQSSPLMDARQFAADMESAYRQMWRTWCQQQSAASPPRQPG